jgi:hypothetical protein
LTPAWASRRVSKVGQAQKAQYAKADRALTSMARAAHKLASASVNSSSGRPCEVFAGDPPVSRLDI